MILKSFCTAWMTFYYIGYILWQIKKNTDKEIIKSLSISLIVTYIIFLALIWIVV